MKFELTDDEDKYKEPTEFCDCNHPDIISKAKELTEYAADNQTIALDIFRFVRDKIKFMLSDFVPASETLKRGIGDCGNKTNLQVALLRALNFQARYHVVSLRKESLKGVVSDIVFQQMPDVIEYHPWCECYLHRKWISCETLFDKALIEGIYKRGIFTIDEIPTIEWDGKNDLIITRPWIIRGKGTFFSLDELFQEIQEPEHPPEMKAQIEELIFQSNQHTDSLREL